MIWNQIFLAEDDFTHEISSIPGTVAIFDNTETNTMIKFRSSCVGIEFLHTLP